MVKKKACPKKGRPLLTYEKHLTTNLGKFYFIQLLLKNIL